MIDILLGLQWGDEGKGKIADYLSKNYQTVARFNGGPNAGHTLCISETEKLVLHSVPSGILNSPCNFIGAGTVINPVLLKKEIEDIVPYQPNWYDKIVIAGEAVIILPVHLLVDKYFDELVGIGTTRKGIGIAYSDLCLRTALMVRDITKANFKDKVEKATQIAQQLFGIKEKISNEEFFESIKIFSEMERVSSPLFMRDKLKKGENILAEGAQGTMLDNRFGTYPFVTSSPCTVGSVLTGLGVNHHDIGKVYGVFKAYTTRVGNGPMPTEIFGDVGKKIQELGNEIGATTGRKRRVGWLDLPQLGYAVSLNGVTDLIMTKGDIFDDKCFQSVYLCDHYSLPGRRIEYSFPNDPDVLSTVTPHLSEYPAWNDLKRVQRWNELPEEFFDYIEYIEARLDTEVSLVSNGRLTSNILEVQN